MSSVVLRLAFLAAAAVGVVAQSQIPCVRSYTVQSGDTCDGISANEGVSTFQLAASNPGINSDCSNIFPSQEICLRRACLSCSTVHVVESGDTCTSIASNAGISIPTLIASNPNLDSGCTNVYPGEVLCVESSF
ncbi:LysM domain-containing protein [Pleurotus pulmonarius]